jgi:hypothetical protein
MKILLAIICAIFLVCFIHWINKPGARESEDGEL